MRYRRNLKVALTLVFVLVVGLVAWSYLRRAYQVYRIVSMPEKLAANVARLARGFEYTESRDGKPVFKVVANRNLELRQGANILEGVELYKYDDQGKVSDTVRSGRAVYQAQQKLAEFDSHVELRLSNGITVRTERMKADLNTQEVEILNGYFFESGRYSGQGSELRYRMQARELQMQQGVELFSRSGESVESYLRADQAMFLLPGNEIILQGKVFFRKGEDTLRAGQVNLAYDFDDRRLSAVEAREGVNLASAAGAALRTLTAAEMTLPVVDGRVSSFDSTGGAQPARIELREAGKGKTLEAVRIQGALDGQGNLTTLDSTDDVRFAELPAGPRAKSRLSHAAFAGGRITAASFSDQAVVDEPSRGVVIGSDTITLGFSSAGDVETLQATGSAALHHAVSGRGVDSRLTADRLEGKFSGGGLLESALGTGNAVLRLQNSLDGSVKTVAAARLTGNFDGKGELTALDAERDVALTLETGKTVRRTFSDAMKSRLAAGQIVWMQQSPRFRLEEGQNVLSGDVAVYQEGVMTVTGESRDPSLAQGNTRTTARRFQVYQADNRVLAQGGVQTEMLAGAEMNVILPAFGGNDPVFVHADNLQLTQNEAIYTGVVTAYQKDYFLFAQRIVLRSQRGLEADGNVRSLFYRLSRGRLKRITAQAPRLIYDRDSHVAKYSGGVLLTTEDGTVSSGTLDLFFNRDNQIENAVAEQNVVVRQGARTGTGNRAQYDFSVGQITLTGNLAQVVDGVRGRAVGRRLIFFIGDDRILVDS